MIVRANCACVLQKCKGLRPNLEDALTITIIVIGSCHAHVSITCVLVVVY